MAQNVVQVANDHMLDFFVASQESRLRVLPASRAFVIPFDEDCERIRALAPVFGYEIATVDTARWVTLGERIFEVDEHRAGIAKAQYFAKLAIFDLAVQHFLFIDANTLFLGSTDQLSNQFARSGHSACFFNRALPGRNFGPLALRECLAEVAPGMRDGFNAGAIFALPDPALYDDAVALAGPGPALKRLLGTAPEQGFLNYVLALTGRRICQVRDLVPTASNSISPGPTTERAGMRFWAEGASYPGSPAILAKWNGSVLHDGLPEYPLLAETLEAAKTRIAATKATAEPVRAAPLDAEPSACRVRAAFAEHHARGGWGGGWPETVSGRGSTMAATEHIRPGLEALVRTLGIRRYIDAPCGDFNWMRHVDLDGASYLGLDVVESLVADNNARFASPSHRFAVANIIEDPLPVGDLIVIRDLVQHLENDQILSILANICRSGIGHAAITSHAKGIPNEELDAIAGFRPVDLSQEPFSLPPAAQRIRDWVPGYTGERYLDVWPVETLRKWQAGRSGSALPADALLAPMTEGLSKLPAMELPAE
ncbi:MAG: class I SAM-dependent methyltransferase [Pseudomonadota bacterium]